MFRKDDKRPFYDPLLTDEDIELLRECRLCPRECGVNRFEQAGVCRAKADVFVSSANLHFGEEPPISGYSGSGTIFLTHCNLRCVYCQNYPISQLGIGNRRTIKQLVDMMLNLQSKGAHNINFVTPSHYVVQIRRAIIIARERGLRIPIVYNTSGYDSLDALELLKGLVEIYMPDLRYFDSEPAKIYSGAADYPEVARKAVKEMHNQVGDLIVGDDGVATRGILIRLLVLPNGISGTEKTLRWIAENLGTNVYLSVMSQYFPAHRAGEFPELKRRIKREEYMRVLEVVDELGFQRGYIQPI